MECTLCRSVEGVREASSRDGVHAEPPRGRGEEGVEQGRRVRGAAPWKG